MENKEKILFETERLMIGYGSIEDYVKVHEYDYNDLQNTTGVTKLTKLDPDEIRKWFDNDIDEWYKKIREKNHYNFIVYLKETGEPIANISFDRNNKEDNSIEAACWLHPNYWGHGYVVEAMIPVMKYIYDQGFENIVAGYLDGNERSKKMQEKLGFVSYGVDQSYPTNYGCITEYKNILSKERYDELYSKKVI